jgi:hypothetical protein
MQQAHTADEHIAVSDLNAATEIFLRIAQVGLQAP